MMRLMLVVKSFGSVPGVSDGQVIKMPFGSLTPADFQRTPPTPHLPSAARCIAMATGGDLFHPCVLLFRRATNPVIHHNAPLYSCVMMFFYHCRCVVLFYHTPQILLLLLACGDEGLFVIVLSVKDVFFQSTKQTKQSCSMGLRFARPKIACFPA
jgi:hypothetical protein